MPSRNGASRSYLRRRFPVLTTSGVYPKPTGRNHQRDRRPSLRPFFDPFDKKYLLDAPDTYIYFRALHEFFIGVGNCCQCSIRECREVGLGRSALVVRISQWAVETSWHSAFQARANKTLFARSKRELAATATILMHLGSAFIAFVGLLGGLLALATYPIIGVLLTLAAMALLLYCVAGLCGAHSSTRQ